MTKFCSSQKESAVRKNLVNCRILTQKQQPDRDENTKQLLGIIGMETTMIEKKKKEKKVIPRKKKGKREKSEMTMTSKFAKSSPSPSPANLPGYGKIPGWSLSPRFPVVL